MEFRTAYLKLINCILTVLNRSFGVQELAFERFELLIISSGPLVWSPELLAWSSGQLALSSKLQIRSLGPVFFSLELTIGSLEKILGLGWEFYHQKIA